VAAFLLLYLGLILLLGTIIDSSSILLIVLPLMLPIAQQFGLNLIWFGVVTVVAVESRPADAALRAQCLRHQEHAGRHRGISLGDIFRGTAPFTLTMLAVLGLLVAFPQTQPGAPEVNQPTRWTALSSTAPPSATSGTTCSGPSASWPNATARCGPPTRAAA
jgi:TRAP-type mannitol/chloroaromatic compound transport system permease large subunit